MDSRQNYAIECENAVNTQINNELTASYTYLAMANYFKRTNVAHYGASAFFHNQHLEELSHAQKLIDYQTDRGGVVQLHVIPAPSVQEWRSLSDAFKDSVKLEKGNNTALLRLHDLASQKNDSDLTNFLEEFYLREQIIEIKQMTAKYHQLKRIGEGLGVHLFDRELAEEVKSKERN
ncbi:unnamed protein product [Bursaphelenchus xylophilus]|uniref:Ferritin n=1 Tax=Bursaphelenchus xylophilus TaxID=6326 RepID=A0A1I7S734_BURXY|nr:unnamed protein product [Bursaphelenchus xylophilus]CAG9084554.1 unnamed protein product [Bursaphelenchus xylophilus]